jgi:Cu+-exporting ATPase
MREATAKNTPTKCTGDDALWAEEPGHLAEHARIRARIAGLHCSLCTGTIEKAVGRQPASSRSRSA